MADIGITELIAAELSVLHQFVGILEREQSALVEGQSELLPALAEEKVRHAEQLAALNRARDTRLRAAGFDTMKAWREAGSLPEKAQNNLDAITVLAIESRRLNELNGKLVADRLQGNQQALNTLLTAAKQSTLYGPDGQTQVGPTGRTLGSA